MSVGLLLVSIVYAPVLVLLFRAEGVASLFAPPRTTVRGLARAWVPAAVSYLVPVALFFTNAVGEPRVSSRVIVAPGSPAATSGLRDGDRVVECNGEPVELFSELAAANKGYGPRHLVVDRAGERLSFEVVPDDLGRLGLRAAGDSKPTSVVQALGLAVQEPFVSMALSGRVIRRLLVEEAPQAVGGPAVIIGSSRWLGLAMGTALGWLPHVGFSALLTVIIFTRRSRLRAARPLSEDK